MKAIIIIMAICVAAVLLTLRSMRRRNEETYYFRDHLEPGQIVAIDTCDRMFVARVRNVFKQSVQIEDRRGARAHYPKSCVELASEEQIRSFGYYAKV